MKTEFTALIIDDEAEHLSMIETFLRVVDCDVNIVGKALSLKQAESLVKKHSPKILFLDIQFDGANETGFDFLKRLHEQGKNDFQVILITAYDEKEYYKEAINLGVAQFLTKPFGPEQLKNAVMRVSPKIGQVTLPKQVPLRHYSNGVPKLTIKNTRFTDVVPINDIVYLKASGRCTDVLRFSEPGSICSTVNLGEYEKKLQPFSEFFRIHNDTIININYILRYSKEDRSIVLPPPFKMQYASRERFKEFVKKMDTES